LVEIECGVLIVRAVGGVHKVRG